MGSAQTAIAIDPSNTNHLVLAGEHQGVGVSFDAGATWTPAQGLSNFEMGDITFDSAGVVWVGTYGGPAKSIDGGLNFTMVASWPRSSVWQDHTPANRRVEKIIVDPTNNNHLFAFNGNQRDLEGNESAGAMLLQPDGSYKHFQSGAVVTPPPSDGQVWESVDGGVNWTLKGDVKAAPVSYVVLDSAAAFAGTFGTMLVATNMGLYRSADSAATWTRIRTDRIRSVVTHPTDPLKAWAATDTGLIKTADGGLTWQALPSGPTPNLPTWRYSIVAISKSNPLVMYASAGFPIETGTHSNFRSTDGGVTWVDFGVGNFGLNGYESIYRSFNDFTNGISIDPTNPNRVIGLNFEDVVETTDGGSTWHSIVATKLSSGKWKGRGFGGAFGTWIGFSDTNPNLVSFSGLDGFNPMVSADGGASYSRPPASYNDNPYYGAVQTDYQPDEVMWTLRGQWYYGYEGVVRVADGGEGAGQLLAGTGGLPAKTFNSTAISLVALTNGAIANIGGLLYRTVNAGSTWTNFAPSGCASPGRLVRAWQSWTHIYLGCDNSILETFDGGVTWAAMVGSPGAGGRDNRLSSGPQGVVVAHRNDPTRIEVFKANKWSTIAIPQYPGMEGIMAAAMDSANPNTIVAAPDAVSVTGQTSSPGALVTQDGGVTWRAIKDGLAVYRFHSLSADPHHPGVFIAGTGGGGFYKIDLGPGIPPATSFVPTVPLRLLDTRQGGVGVKVTAGTVYELQVGGVSGLPASLNAVVLSVTVDAPAAPGFVTVFPCGQPLPNASTLNFAAGQSTANSATIGTSNDGRVCFFTSATTHLIVDVNGYYPLLSPYVALAPSRLLDSRSGGSTVDGVSAGIGTRTAGSVTEVQVGGRASVPTNAAAVLLNVTVDGPAAGGFLTVYPCGQPVPNASNLNFSAGQTTANAVSVALGTAGLVCVATSASTNVLLDVTGYHTSTSTYIPAATPARILDSRPGGSTIDHLSEGIGLRGSTSITELQVSGRAGVPTNARAVVLNVTVTGPTGSGFLTVYPCGQPLPDASNLNHVARQTTANSVTVSVGVGGKVCVYTYAETHLIADLSGYFPA